LADTSLGLINQKKNCESLSTYFKLQKKPFVKAPLKVKLFKELAPTIIMIYDT